MESTSKAKKLLTELLEPGSSPPSTLYKILLMGLRDAYESHLDLLIEREPVDKANRLKEYYQEGLRFWRVHDRERAIYYLGGALYHLQDAWFGLTDDPTYEAYLEKTLKTNQPQPLVQGIPTLERVNPEKMVEEAIQERQKVDSLIKQELIQNGESSNQLNQISTELARRAEIAGAALLLQFFLEADQGA